MHEEAGRGVITSARRRQGIAGAERAEEHRERRYSQSSTRRSLPRARQLGCPGPPRSTATSGRRSSQAASFRRRHWRALGGSSRPPRSIKAERAGAEDTKRSSSSNRIATRPSGRAAAFFYRRRAAAAQWRVVVLGRAAARGRPAPQNGQARSRDSSAACQGASRQGRRTARARLARRREQLGLDPALRSRRARPTYPLRSYARTGWHSPEIDWDPAARDKVALSPALPRDREAISKTRARKEPGVGSRTPSGRGTAQVTADRR